MSNSRDISSMKESQVAKAWVNFDGSFATSPFTEANGGIRGSFNVSSISDEGVGTYTINFDKAFSNSNWTMAGAGKFNLYTDQNMPVISLDRKVADSVSPTASSARIACTQVVSTPTQQPYVDPHIVLTVFFGD